MGRRPTSRVTVLSVIAEMHPLSSSDGTALKQILEAMQPYNISTSAVRQQIEAMRKLGLIDVLSERGKMYEVEITSKGLSYLEENSTYIKTALSKPVAVEPPRQSTVTITDLDDFFEASRQAEGMVASLVRRLKELESKLKHSETENDNLRLEHSQLQTKHLALLEEAKTLRQKLAVHKDRELGTLRPSQLPKVWRGLAEIAVDQGWRITLSGGDHIQWVSPTGSTMTSAQTPSDHRSVKNFRAQLARKGLVVR